MKKLSQKQKNDLIFQLLSLMNPFIINPTHKKKVKGQIQNIFHEQRKKVTFKQQPEEESVKSISSFQKETEPYRSMKSQVFNIKIGEQLYKQKLQDEQEQKEKLEQLRKHKTISKSIVNIQKQAFEAFKIPYESSQPEHQIKNSLNKNMSQLSTNESKYMTKSSQFVKKEPMIQGKTQPLPLERSSSTKTFNSYRSERLSEKNQPALIQNKKISIFEGKMESEKKKNEFQTPKKSFSSSNISLGLQSRIRSKTPDTIKRTTRQKATSIKEKTVPIKIKYESFERRKVGSQILQRQSHKLDVAILSNMLNSKLSTNPSSISSLIKH